MIYVRKIYFYHQISADWPTFIKFLWASLNLFCYVRSPFCRRFIDFSAVSSYNLTNTILFLRIQDLPVFLETFFFKAYAVPDFLLKNHLSIMDLGAHVGIAASYFELHHKISRYIAVEASPKNSMILEKNFKTDDQKIIVKKAIYSLDGEVQLDENTFFSYNHHLSQTAGLTVESIKLSSLFDQLKIKSLDILKVDIEGAEIHIFSENIDYLKKVHLILIELHNSLQLAEIQTKLSTIQFAQKETNNGLNQIYCFQNTNFQSVH